MTPPVPGWRGALIRLLLAAVALGMGDVVTSRVRAQEGDDASRQVTLFGIVATPNDPTIDPKLKAIVPQLTKLLPDHGFKLLDVQSRRLAAGQSVTAQLGHGYTASTTLLRPVDENGKVQLRCDLARDLVPQLGTQVATPPNQLFFCDKLLGDGSHLLIGVGAR